MSNRQDLVEVTVVSPLELFFEACRHRNNPAVKMQCFYTTASDETVVLTRVDTVGWCVPGHNSSCLVTGMDSEGRRISLTITGPRYRSGRAQVVD